METFAPLAHGVGARGDLPIPLWIASWGAGAVLVLSFVALGVLWPRARFEGQPHLGRVVLPAPAARVVAVPVRLLGVVLVGLVWAAAIAGPNSVTNNLAPYAVYVAFWVGLTIVAGFLGDVWQLLSPFETGLRLAGRGDARPLERLGHWPAAVLLLAFGWIELVHPEPADPRMLAQAIGVYIAIIVVGAAVAGPGWVRSAEAFGVIFHLIGQLPPFHRGPSGELRIRPPLVGLADVRPVRGTAAVILVALGTTTFDGLTRLAAWEQLVAGRAGWDIVPLKTAGLLFAVGLVAAIYVWAMREAATRVGEASARGLVDAFVHSLIPIALAYAIAHYFSLLVFEGQRLVALTSDPFARGWDLLGTVDWQVDYRTLSSRLIAWVQAGAIVVGHVAGVVLAHDRAVALYPGRDATRSQYALLVAMVAYTMGGLVLLLGG